MYANYELISCDLVQLINLLDPTFQYNQDIFSGGACPLIFSNQGLVKWQEVKFGWVPNLS